VKRWVKRKALRESLSGQRIETKFTLPMELITKRSVENVSW
jgi:hypothetical protein